jgi:uncharacterized protein (DUF58 family)
MYVTNRFFYLFGSLTVLFALSYSLEWLFVPAQVLFWVGIAAVLCDTFILFYRRPNVTCQRSFASVFSLSDPNPVEIRLENKTAIDLWATIQDEVPMQLQWRDFVLYQPLPTDAPQVVEYKVIPLSRGEYNFGDTLVFLQTLLGLVERRLRFKHPAVAAVYPSIVQMKRYELRAMRNVSQEIGIKKMRRIGHSYEFEQIKTYVQGDDYRSINWKASGRHAAFMVNQYEEERSQQVYCLIDKSRVMRMPFSGLSLMDYAINCALAISNIILKKQDKAGLITFSDALGGTLKAERDTKQISRISETLYREKERSGEANYDLLYEAVRKLIGSRSLLLLFTNFESSYALERALPTLRRLNNNHLLVVVFFENTEVRQLAQEPVERTADIFRQTTARRFLQDKKEMVTKLRTFGIQAVLTRPQDLTLNTINKYLELKSRGLI